MNRYKIIACKVLFRELNYYSALSKNIIDITYIKQELHNTPELLKKSVQTAIKDIEEEDEEYNAILLGYGLCSNGIAGIKSNKYPIIIPRAHDCITLLLGSKEMYKEYFDSNPGVYWYSRGWIERSKGQPDENRYNNLLNEYIAKYGNDNAEYLMQMEQSWLSKYKKATYIEWDGISIEEHRNYTKESANFFGWDYDEIKGSATIIEKLIEGNWDDEMFLILQPGETVQQSVDDNVIIKKVKI